MREKLKTINLQESLSSGFREKSGQFQALPYCSQPHCSIVLKLIHSFLYTKKQKDSALPKYSWKPTPAEISVQSLI